MPQMLSFPFGKGLHQENDERMQEPGTPSSILNLVRTKNGRLEMRRDYETIAMTCASTTSIQLFDLHSYQERLVAFGEAAGVSGFEDLTDKTCDEVFDLVELSNNWRRNTPATLSQASQVRAVGRVAKLPAETKVYDCAAGAGFVCEVLEVIPRPDLGTTKSVIVHVFRAEDDLTILTQEIAAGERPKVVFCGSQFFISNVITATNGMALRSYNPLTQIALVLLTSPVAAGAAIVAYDLSLSLEGTSFWLAFCRSDTTTGVRGMSNAGAVTFTTAGPAVLGDAIGIMVEAVGGTQRVHVAITKNATGNVDLTRYLPPSTTPTTVADIGGAGFKARGQVVMATNPGSAGSMLLLYQNLTNDLTLTSFGDRIMKLEINSSTYAVTLAQQLTVGPILNSKLRVIKSRMFFAVVQPEGVFSTHALMRLANVGGHNPRPVTVSDRFLAQACNPIHLCNIDYDSSTDLAYMIHSLEDTSRVGQPSLKELKLCSQDRRQTAQLGDILYISGGTVMAFDGRVAAEAGGFLTRPVIGTHGATTGGGGAMTSSSIYQSLVTLETNDAKGRRLQSAPSDIVEDATGVADVRVNLTMPSPITWRDNIEGIFGLGPSSMQTFPRLCSYHTERTDDGNITFQRDATTQVVGHMSFTAYVINEIKSDVDLSDEEIVYTQGARGALSGPLEFVCPDSATTLCASADKILTGGLPEESRIQESRPLFVGEQVQWSDSIGFYRDIRNRVLAVARLDERRILFSAREIFECDGPGLDDNGLGDLGAPRRLPSDVGIYGGVLGWRSIVEISAGILFQGLRNQIYLLPRGGVTPQSIGFAVEDVLDAYPEITSAIYMPQDQTVRFTCNNETRTESIVLLFNVQFAEWFVEGPFAFGIRAGAQHEDRFVILTTSNTVLRQLESHPPLAFIPQSWKAQFHPFKPGLYGRVYAFWFVGGFGGNCRLRATVTWDDGTVEVHDWFDVIDLEPDQEVAKRFEFNQLKCENCHIEFETSAFQNQPTAGLTFNYLSLETDPSGVPRQVGPEDMT